ncbi:glycosyltransferase family 2 protein [Parasediminibacterium sp. JCM 36343]|uniref:glycosyltransferase family 2 protein n=1 Tax=Parasediminibacterium sp. JCM 36343 TaxID=3374279 RepID=UPI00397A6BA2
MSVPTVSIIMPAYNAEKYIAESIQSAREQTFDDWELIVVDDGSTDTTAKIVKEAAIKDDRIVYIYKENKKLPAARNTCIRNSKGDFIAFLDADDLWMPEKLQKQVSIFEEQKVDIVFTNGFILQEETQALIDYPTKPGFYGPKEMYGLQYFGNYIPVLSVLIKKELIVAIGEQDESLIYGCEDWDYWLRAARIGATFYGMPEKLFKYRVHEGGMSRKRTVMQLAEFTALYKNIDYRFLSKGNIYIRLAGLMEQNAPALLAEGKNELAAQEIWSVLKLRFSMRYWMVYLIAKLNIKPLFKHVNYFFHYGSILLKARKS